MLRFSVINKNKILLRSQGFSLVEMLIALAILSVISLGVASMLTDTSQVIKMTEITNSRDQIARDIESAMQRFALVKESAKLANDGGNVNLKECLDNYDKLRPNKCKSNKKKFVMYNRSSGGFRAVAGSDANPVYYSMNGAPCNKPACQYFRADAYFKPTCIASPGIGVGRSTAQECDQATSVTLQYQVVPLMVLGQAQRMLKKRPENLEESSIDHKVSGILVNQTCPSMAKMKGFTTDGKIVCECVIGARQIAGTPSNTQIQCVQQTRCQDDEVWLGFKSDGTPECAKKTSYCVDEKRDTNDNGAFCGNGGWVDRIDMGRCISDGGKGGKKGEEVEVECPNARVSCCYEKRARP